MADDEVKTPCLDLWRDVKIEELHWQFALTRMSEVVQPPFTIIPSQIRLTLDAVQAKVEEKETPDNLALLGHSCWFANEIDRAEETYKKALGKDGANPLVNRLYGYFLMWKQQWDNAADRLRAAVASDPGNLDARAALAESLFMKGKKKGPEKKEMKENYDAVEAGDLNSMSPDSIVRLGVHKQSQKEWRAAVFYFEQAYARTHGRSFYVLSRYGDFCRAVGRLNDGERMLSEALELRPDSVWARVRLAHLRYLRGDIDGALREYQIIIHFVKTEESIAMYADLLRIKGDANSAREMFEKIVAKAPKFLWAVTRLWWLNVSLGVANDGDYMEAIGSIQSEQARFLPQWYKNDNTILQAIYEQTQDINDDMAQASWSSGGIESSAELQYNYAMSLLKANDEHWSKAERALNKALDIDPTHFKSLLKLGELHVSEGPLKNDAAGGDELNRALEVLKKVFEPQQRHMEAKAKLVDLLGRANLPQDEANGLYS